jgi:hypothetical protein
VRNFDSSGKIPRARRYGAAAMATAWQRPSQLERRGFAPSQVTAARPTRYAGAGGGKPRPFGRHYIDVLDRGAAETFRLTPSVRCQFSATA